jgi:hypothetical protein
MFIVRAIVGLSILGLLTFSTLIFECLLHRGPLKTAQLTRMQLLLAP